MSNDFPHRPGSLSKILAIKIANYFTIVCLPFFIIILLLSAKHAFVSNYTGLGNRQAPS